MPSSTTTRRRLPRTQPTPEQMGAAIARATRLLQDDLQPGQPRVVVACAARHAALNVLLCFPATMPLGDVVQALESAILPPGEGI